jgi:exodeoxyribonuclease VII small subunit
VRTLACALRGRVWYNSVLPHAVYRADLNPPAKPITAAVSRHAKEPCVNAPSKPNLSYEEAYKRLEEAVAQLSAGGLSLEEALARFEQGMALANYCGTLLDQAELRVQQVGQLASEEMEALIDGGTPAPAAQPATEPPKGTLAGPLGGPGRRGLPPTTGPQRKPAASGDLDPLFDDI